MQGAVERPKGRQFSRYTNLAMIVEPPLIMYDRYRAKGVLEVSLGRAQQDLVCLSGQSRG
jgi:hypothetical protein